MPLCTMHSLPLLWDRLREFCVRWLSDIINSYHIAMFGLVFVLRFILFWVFSLRLCEFTVCVAGVHGGQNRLLDPLELDLWMILSHHGVPGNWTESSGRTASAIYWVSLMSSPIYCLLCFHSTVRLQDSSFSLLKCQNHKVANGQEVAHPS